MSSARSTADVKLHKIALKMTKTRDKIMLDFTGTDPQIDGPINWPADYADGAFLIKWIAPILRNLADSPERAAEINVNEGVCEIFDVIFPPKGTLITPVWPAPTNARSFVLLRCLSLLAGVVAQAVDGRMPADQETIRYTGFYGTDLEGKPFLSREVLGGGSGGRYLRRRQRRDPYRAGFAQPAGRIHRDQVSLHRREACTAHGFRRRRQAARRTRLRQALSRAGRLPHHRDGRPRQARLLRRQWRPCRPAVLRHGRSRRPNERRLGGLVDGEPVQAGQVVRVETTGGGGWGDPLEREPELVLRDVIEGKVSPAAARDDYGVCDRRRAPARRDRAVLREADARRRARRLPRRIANRQAADDRPRPRDEEVA